MSESVERKKSLRSHSGKSQKKAEPNQHENGKKKTSSKEDIQEELTDFQRLERLLNALTSSVGTIQADITELKTSKSKVKVLTDEIKRERTKIDKTIEKVDVESFKLKLVTAIAIKQSHEIASLKKEVAALRSHMRRPNLSISGILEGENETKKSHIELVNNFFKNEMEIEEPIVIRKVNRVGKFRPRSLAIVLDDPSDKATIFSHVSNLKGKTNAKKKLYFVNDDLSEEEREQRKYFQQLKAENAEKEVGERVNIQLKRGKIWANNKEIMSKILVPAPIDTLTLDVQELSDVMDVKTYEASSHTESGSEFIVHYQRVATPDDVQQGLVKMKIKYGDAAHVVTVYRLANANGPYGQSFKDDQEHGTGRRILEAMKDHNASNLAIFAARYSGAAKMGVRHFEVYVDLAKTAIKAHRIWMDKLARSS